VRRRAGPSAELNTPPARAPDEVAEQKLGEDQALLYRLTGDLNPLHVDPEAATAFGLTRPILHGLCTYGFAARHVMHAFAGDDPAAMRAIRVRFATPVYPGETLVTEMWRQSEARVVFRCKVKERDRWCSGTRRWSSTGLDWCLACRCEIFARCLLEPTTRHSG